MPYDNVAEMLQRRPELKALPSQARQIFFSAFNSAFATYKGDEAKANATAWSAVKRRYIKEGDKWMAKLTNSIDSHQIILNTLNQWMDYDGDKVYYDIDSFKGTEQLWDGIPVVFTDGNHLDDELYSQNPDEALKQINGRIAGYLNNTEVITQGQPRAVADITITDPELEELYSSGKLSLSTSINSKIDEENRTTGKVTPNHLILFERKKNINPRDRGAMLLNSERGDSMEDEPKINYVKEIELKNSEIEKLGTSIEALTLKNAELSDEREKLNSAIAEKDEAIAKYEEEMKEKSTMLESFEKEKKDRAWADIKAQLPKGKTFKEEDEKALRDMFEQEPHKFIREAMQFNNVELLDAEGKQFANSEKEEEATSDIIGVWNFKEGRYE